MPLVGFQVHRMQSCCLTRSLCLDTLHDVLACCTLQQIADTRHAGYGTVQHGIHCLQSLCSASHAVYSTKVVRPSNVCLQKITSGALWMELAAVVVLGATVFAFDYFNSSESGYYTY